MNTKKHIWFHRIILAICIMGIGFGLRAYAANSLNIDYDEPTYLEAALEYTNYIREGKYNWIAWNDTNFEHPALYKILYGVVLLSQPPIDNFYDRDLPLHTPMTTAQAAHYGMAGRWLSVILGSVTVGITALLNPAAGYFVATNTSSVKYTSMVYLEALPFLFSLLTILAYSRFFIEARKVSPRKNKLIIYLLASGVFLGVTAASKYLYCIVGLAVLVHAILHLLKNDLQPSYIPWIVGWGLTSILTFFIFNPYLWPHPYERFMASLNFHINYPSTKTVIQLNYPWWQPLRWLFQPFKYYNPSPISALILQTDPAIFILAIIGLPRTYKRYLIYFIWLVMGLITLLLWGTKWPQYVMIVMVPYSMAAAQGVATLYDLAKSLVLKLRKPASQV